MSPHSRRKRTRAATLADIGRAAGVSAMAASAVLNGARTSSRISPATRTRILEAAQRLSYRPNGAARALAARRMNTIGVATVVGPGDLNTYFLEIFNGIVKAAEIQEQTTTVFPLHDWDSDAARRLPRICDGRIDGMILIAPHLSPDAVHAMPTHTPFVTIHNNFNLPGVVNLETDEETGAYNLVRHLISRGHRRILHFTGNRGLLGAERRVQGYQRALTDGGLPFDPLLVVDSGFTTPDGIKSAREWLQKLGPQPLPDAIFCASDGIAIGVLEVLAEAGISIPNDVSIAGFDDTLAARTTAPQLTTVRQPLSAMGRQAVEALLLQVRSDHNAPTHDAQTTIVFPTELVVRQSVADRAVRT